MRIAAGDSELVLGEVRRWSGGKKNPDQWLYSAIKLPRGVF